MTGSRLIVAGATRKTEEPFSVAFEKVVRLARATEDTTLGDLARGEEEGGQR